MIQCKNCKTEITEDMKTCSVCNYPIKGSEKEQVSFIAKQVIQKSAVKDAIGHLKKSRITLFILGAFYLIAPFTTLIGSKIVIIYLFSFILGLTFIGFAFLTYKKPLIAIGIPLGITIFYYFILLLINPIYLWMGFLWKILTLMGLGYGFFSVRKSNKILKKNKYLASILGFDEVK